MKLTLPLFDAPAVIYQVKNSGTILFMSDLRKMNAKTIQMLVLSNFLQSFRKQNKIAFVIKFDFFSNGF